MESVTWTDLERIATGPFAALLLLVLAAIVIGRWFVSGKLIPGPVWDALMGELTKLRVAFEQGAVSADRQAAAQEKSNELNASLLAELRRRA